MRIYLFSYIIQSSLPSGMQKISCLSLALFLIQGKIDFSA